MCIPGLDPATLLGVAASVGGSLVNNQIQNQAIKEQNRQNQIAMDRERQARMEEVARQRNWETSQAEEVTRALAAADPQRVEQETQRRVDEPDNRVIAAADEYNIPALQGQVQNEDINLGATIADRANRTREMLRAAALLQGQSGAFNDVSQALFGMGSNLAETGGYRRGSMNAASLETSVPAATVTRSHSPIGDLLMLGGQAMAGRAGQRAGFGGTQPYNPGAMIGQPLSAIPWLR